MARYGVCRECHESVTELGANHVQHNRENPTHFIEWEDLTKKSVPERLDELEARVKSLERWVHAHNV